MQITSRTSGPATILDLAGKITIGEGAVQLREAVGSAMEQGATNIVLNLGGVAAVDSSGVGELVSTHTTLTNRGGKLALINLPAKLSDILMITQLITVFSTFDSEAEAIASFS